MGTYKTNLAEAEEDENKKNVLLEEAEEYFIKALELGPKHQEILIGQAKMEMARGDYNKMKDYSMQCVSLDPSLSDCYWYLAISQIYLKDTESAKTNIEMAARRGYQVESEAKLKELANVYASIQDNQALADIFEKLTKINPENPQYHSTLAFFYKELRRYKEARAEALKTLELSPESKDNVNAFLKTLPY
jgi:tetratricopeptide (TPR) repeat protein